MERGGRGQRRSVGGSRLGLAVLGIMGALVLAMLVASCAGGGKTTFTGRAGTAVPGSSSQATESPTPGSTAGAGAPTAPGATTGLAGTATTGATAGSGTGSSTATTKAQVCSASALQKASLTAQPGLPAPVAATREQIFQAAKRCDFAALERLALAGSPDFSYSADQPSTGGRPGHYWQEQEAAGRPVLAQLVTLLDMPSISREELEAGVTVWPAAYSLDWAHLSAADRASVSGAFPAADVAAWEKAGAYLGYRIGIGKDGAWLFFDTGP